MPITVTGLFIYPVKSLRGLSLREAALDAHGLVGDRRFLVVRPDGSMLTQRSHPRMALIDTALGQDLLSLSAAGQGQVQVPLASDPAAPLLTVGVWSSQGMQAEDCGEAVAVWLTRQLGEPCRLVRMGAAYRRPLLAKKRPSLLAPELVPQVSFADAFPFLILSQASLDDLNTRLVAGGTPALPLDRFRTNLFIDGCEPFAEDTWARFTIGTTRFLGGGPCSRCVMTTLDQATGERAPEPLRTLASYRRDPLKQSDVNFGQNLVHETHPGIIRVGDRLEIIEKRG